MGESNGTEEYVGTAESLFILPCAKKIRQPQPYKQKAIETEGDRNRTQDSIPEDEIFYTPFEMTGFSSFDMTTAAALVDAVPLVEGGDINPRDDAPGGHPRMTSLWKS